MICRIEYYPMKLIPPKIKILYDAALERKRWFQNDLWLNKSVQNGSIQNVSIRLMRFHEI